MKVVGKWQLGEWQLDVICENCGVHFQIEEDDVTIQKKGSFILESFMSFFERYMFSCKCPKCEVMNEIYEPLETIPPAIIKKVLSHLKI